MTTLQRMTFADLMAQPDDGCLHELVRREILYPKTRTAMVFHPDGSARTIPANGALDDEDVLPGFAEDLATIFA